MIKNFFILLFFISPIYAEKIIGLMQVKNEADIIEYSLRALAQNVDGIIILDDASQDNTLEVVKRLAKELPIIEIIENNQCEWTHGSEATSKQKLIDRGRAHGGTHFLALDADEVLTTECAQNNWLRNKLLSLQKGQSLAIPLINLWKSFEYYRSTFDDNFPNICYCSIGYCDDGISTIYDNLKHSHSGFLHMGRFPHVNSNYPYPLFVYESDINHSIIHMPFINWHNVIIKKIWIIMLEIIRLKDGLYNKEKFPHGRTVQDIDNFYETFHEYDKPAQLSPTPFSWLDYPFFKQEPFFKKIPVQKLQNIKDWIQEYGLDLFKQSRYIRKHISSILEIAL